MSFKLRQTKAAFFEELGQYQLTNANDSSVDVKYVLPSAKEFVP